MAIDFDELCSQQWTNVSHLSSKCLLIQSNIWIIILETGIIEWWLTFEWLALWRLTIQMILNTGWLKKHIFVLDYFSFVRWYINL